jgi:YHS domain-containing protein
MKAAAQGVFGAAATDPVCGMEVDQKRAAAAGHKSEHNGKTYYFCSDDCKNHFDKEPGKYAGR